MMKLRNSGWLYTQGCTANLINPMLTFVEIRRVPNKMKTKKNEKLLYPVVLDRFYMRIDSFSRAF